MHAHYALRVKVVPTFGYSEEWDGWVLFRAVTQSKEEKSGEATKEMAAQCLQLAVLVVAGSLPNGLHHSNIPGMKWVRGSEPDKTFTGQCFTQCELQV